MTAQDQESAGNPKKVPKHAKQLQKQYAKQQHRKTLKDTLPSPHLDIPLDHYTSLVSHLKSSKRFLALFGAGLSAAPGFPTFPGQGGFCREYDCTVLELLKPSTSIQALSGNSIITLDTLR